MCISHPALLDRPRPSRSDLFTPKSHATSFPALRRWAILLAALVLLIPSLAWGGRIFKLHNSFWAAFTIVLFDLPTQNESAVGEPADSALAPAGVAVPQAATYHLTNLRATLEPGEPTVGGRMTRTIWGRLVPSQDERVVIHTIGSQTFASTARLDTVLAVYTGSAVNALPRIASNDNRRVPGIADTYSLVQFDAQAGVPYSVQIGSRDEAEGEIFANVFRFPAGGGLSAFLARTGFNDFFNGQDYFCSPISGANPCPNPTFVVHNSTDQTVSVTGTSGLGPGVVSPAPFTLSPGALRVVQFVFTSGFDATTVRTTSAKFTFTARVGTTVVSRATHRALIVHKSFSLPRLDIVEATPTARAGFVNEPLAFTVKLRNPGAEAALGCHFRSSPFERVKTVFQRIDPVTGNPIGSENRPATLPAGATRTFRVMMASQCARVADPEFAPPIIIDCANSEAAFDLSSNFGVTARGDAEPADIPAEVTSPVSRILNVPPTGFARFRVRAVNQGPTSTVIARPRYIRPFGEDDPLKQFGVSICRTNPTTGACLAPAASSVTYTAKRNLATTFAVLVKAPAVDPGFDPGLRRVFLDFRMDDNVNPNFVGSASVAVKKQ